MAQTIKYRGLEFNLQSSGNAQADGRYHAELTFKMGNETISRKYSSKTLEGLERRHEEKKASLFNCIAKKGWTGIQENMAVEQAIDLPLFYAVWREDIISYMGRAESTINRKEADLLKLFDHLAAKPLAYLTLDDFIEAAAKVICGTDTIKDATPQQMGKYKTLLQTLCLVLDRATILGFFYSNPVSEYVELIKIPADVAANIKESQDMHSLEEGQEEWLYRFISYGLPKEGLMFGAALLLLEGIEIETACELKFKDIISLKHIKEPMRVLRIAPQYKGDGKEDMPDPQRARRLPMHWQMDRLFEEWMHLTEKRIKDRGFKDELKDVYLVRKGERIKGGVTPAELRAFLKTLFNECGIAARQDISLPGEKKVEFKLNCAKYLRSNFEQHMVKCGTTEDEINILMGRTANTTDARHYRDWNSDLCLLNLKAKMDRWSIHSDSYRPGDLTLNNGLEVIDTGNRHVKMSAQLIAEESGKYRIRIKSKKGMNVAVTLTSGGEHNV